ncbi:MAG TPA: photosystem I reaction center subunit PsaK [Cyanothece sp. UBA12306]|nr:photosystem I reaction center subunit PsaK [Cyanothece sp. UBA12306]
MYSTFLLAAASVPTTIEWSPQVAFVMIISNVVAIAIGKFTIAKPSEGTGLPASAMFGGMGLGSLLGTTSLGHILGVGLILGLANAGAL